MPKRVFITVAEVSGDRHAAQLIKGLRELDPEIVVEGHGGPEMQAAGAKIHSETVGRAAMGWRGALRAAEIYKVLKWTKRHFDAYPPDLQIGVDSPSMNFHFAKAAKGRGIPVMQYVAPQLWAWAGWRMKKVRKWVDRLACILPFEEEYFRRHGVDATFVGHPIFDELPPARGQTPGPRFPERPPVIGILPGSRKSVARANLPHLLYVAGRVREVFPDASFLIPTTAATHPVVKEMIGDAAGADGDDPAAQSARRAGAFRDSLTGETKFFYAKDAFDEMVPRCDLCLTVSGTATLHVAAFGVPMVVVYRGNPVLWHALGRWLVKTRTYSVVNLLAADSPAGPAGGRAEHVVPEFMPWYGSDDPVADLALDLLCRPEGLAEQRDKLQRLVRSLDHPGVSKKAAGIAMKLLTSGTALPRPTDGATA